MLKKKVRYIGVVNIFFEKKFNNLSYNSDQLNKLILYEKKKDNNSKQASVCVLMITII